MQLKFLGDQEPAEASQNPHQGHPKSTQNPLKVHVEKNSFFFKTNVHGFFSMFDQKNHVVGSILHVVFNNVPEMQNLENRDFPSAKSLILKVRALKHL